MELAFPCPTLLKSGFCVPFITTDLGQSQQENRDVLGPHTSQLPSARQHPGKAQLTMSRQSCHSDFIALSFQKSPNWSIYSISGEVITGWVFFFFSILNPSQVSGYFEAPFIQTSLGRDVSSAIPDAVSAAGLCRAKRLPKRVDCHMFTPQHLVEYNSTILCPPAQYPTFSQCIFLKSCSYTGVLVSELI